MNGFVSNLKWFVPGLLLGAVVGYVYYHYWGCDGNCMITSSPWRSMVYFAVMGVLVNNMFKPDRSKAKKEEVSDN